MVHFEKKSDAKNAKFIQELQKGYVPAELEKEARKEWGNIDKVKVQLIDKSKEDYVPPKKAFSFSDSKGQNLGGVKKVSVASFDLAIPAQYVLNPDDQKTTLQLVLHDRKKVRAEFNHNSTIFDVYQHLMYLTSREGFILYAGFPPKPLTDPDATIAGANLLGASIEQRLQR